jgi:hypothetical protein
VPAAESHLSTSHRSGNWVSMNLRHAAAFALVGWYLVMPPPLTSNPNKPDLIAPLSKWIVREQFDTASKCKKSRQVVTPLEHDPNFQPAAETAARQQGQVFSVEKWRAFAEPQKCIASDDPRLKAK